MVWCCDGAGVAWRGVQEREKALDDKWAAVSAAQSTKQAVLQDDLARETFREKVVLTNQQHTSQHATLKVWLEDKQQYLEKKESISASRDARFQLEVLELYAKAKNELVAGGVAAFRALGKGAFWCGLFGLFGVM